MTCPSRAVLWMAMPWPPMRPKLDRISTCYEQVSGGLDGALHETLLNAGAQVSLTMRVYRGACVWTDGQLEGALLS